MLPNNLLTNPLLTSLEEAHQPETKIRQFCSRKGLVVLLCVLGLFLIFGAVFHSSTNAFLTAFLHRIEGLGWWAAVLVLSITLGLNLVMMPTFPMMVGAGALFGHMYGVQLGATIGVFSVFSGLWLGSMLSFLLGRSCYKKWALQKLREFDRMGVFEELIQEEGWRIVFLARMCPFLPAEQFNYAFSVTPLTPYEYGVSCVGSVVPVSFWVLCTAQSTSLVHGNTNLGREIILIGINVVVLGVLSARLYVVFKKYKAKVEEHIRNHQNEVVHLSSDVGQKLKTHDNSGELSPTCMALEIVFG